MSRAKIGRVNWYRVLLVLIDLFLLNVGVFAAYWLRLEGRYFMDEIICFYSDAGFILPVGLLIFYLFGLYNRVWQYASAEAVLAIVGAVTTTTVLAGAALGLQGSPGFLPTALVMLLMVWLMLVGGSRFCWRVLRQYQWVNSAARSANGVKRVIIYGAGEAGAALARRIEHDREGVMEVVGFVDDDARKQNMYVRRGRVLGTGADLPKLVRQRDVDEVLIAVPSASGAEIRLMVQRCAEAGATHSLLPSRLETMDQPVSLSQLREVEVTDLLSRDTANFPVDTCGTYLQGKCVLVTGAGGSIGAEICRQAVRFNPRKLVLFGRGENRIHDIYQELRRQAPELQFVPVIANFAAPGVAEAAFREHRPEVVFHAGAHKHVYLMETNVVEAVRNNVFGTELVLQAAKAAGVDIFVLISTDKAAEPTSIMGATKRMCEVLAAKAAANGERKRVIAVRFGNVLGTNGSVLRIFEQQLLASRPLTITHPETSRYFMSCEEAALLVIEAGNPEHHSGTYLLDMGEPVVIQDLAGELIRLWGGDPDDPRNYEYIGLFPGEKLHEELINPWEDLERLSSYLFRIDGPAYRPGADVALAVAQLKAIATEGDQDDLRHALFDQIEVLKPEAPAGDRSQARGQTTPTS